MSRGILSRLRAPGGSHRLGIEPSVRAHVLALLNTRQFLDAKTPITFDLVHDFPRALPALGRAIKETLGVYEPRLTQLQVSVRPDPQRWGAQIQIMGQLREATGPTPLRIKARLDAQGRIHLQ